MAITEEINNVCKLKDYIFLTEGHYGCYVNNKEIKIDISKLREFVSDTLDPEKLFNITMPAKATNHLYRYSSNKIAVKVEADNGIFAWINQGWLKQFGDNVNIRITNEKSTVYISDYRGKPLGIILPININPFQGGNHDNKE
jgi:hypothetical protein